MPDINVTVLPVFGPGSPDSTYKDGLSRIVDGLRSRVEEAVTTAFDEHRTLVSSLCIQRLMEPLEIEKVRPVERLVGMAPTTMPFSVSAKSPRQRTTREIVLDVIADAPEPLPFADVKAAVTAAGGSEASAHKMRTDLLKRGAILNRRGLYTITETGQAIRTGYG